MSNTILVKQISTFIYMENYRKNCKIVKFKLKSKKEHKEIIYLMYSKKGQILNMK